MISKRAFLLSRFDFATDKMQKALKQQEIEKLKAARKKRLSAGNLDKVTKIR